MRYYKRKRCLMSEMAKKGKSIESSIITALKLKFNNLYLIAQSSVKFRGKPLRMCTLSCKATVKVANESVLRSM